MNLGFKTKINLPEIGIWETHFPEKVQASFGVANGYIPKLTTLREDPNNRWQPGKDIHFATGVRSANYNCFHFEEKGCKSVQEIIIKNDYCRTIKIDGQILYIQNEFGNIQFKNFIETFIKNDGFDTVEQFWAWFNKPVWQGKIIHWTDLKY